MLEQFKNAFPTESEKLHEYAACFKRLEYPAKKLLLAEGQISKKMYFIEKGCIRVWLNNNGKDTTVQFFFENETVGSIESIRKNKPSLTNIETVESCIVWSIHKNDLHKIIEEIVEVPALREMFINKIFERTFDYMKYFFSSIKDSPQQRYLNLIEERPQVIQRVPQHYIASYLGISPVHLSRIKNSIANLKSKNI